MLYDLICVWWNLKKTKKLIEIRTDCWLPKAGSWEMGKIGKGGQKIETLSFKISHGM